MRWIVIEANGAGGLSTPDGGRVRFDEESRIDCASPPMQWAIGRSFKFLTDWAERNNLKLVNPHD